MSNYQQQNLNITDLLLNTSNPRFDPVGHQKEAIDEIVLDQREKLVTLARHIAEYGLNPIDPLLVQPHGTQWLIREGNRRATALKLVNEPDLLPQEASALKKGFEELNHQLDSDLLKNIPCIVIEDEARINEWVRLKHTGQNEGAGTVGWDATQIARFRVTVEGKPDRRLEFLDYLQSLDGIPLALKESLPSIKKTNFDRLMDDPDVRTRLGLDIQEELLRPIGEVNGLLLKVLQDLSSGQLTVSRIYSKADRAKYLDCIMRKQSKPSTQQGDKIDSGGDSGYAGRANEDEAVGTKGGTPHREPDKDTPTEPKRHIELSSKKPRKKSGKSYPINRRTLVPSSHSLTIGQARLLKIFNELKTLRLETYPNAAAVLFRAFIEMSADYYLDSMPRNNGVTADGKMTQKIDAICKHMEETGIMTKHELRPVRQMVASPSQTQSIRTFHSYVHNMNVTPAIDDLKSAWDDIWKFIENLWR